MSFSSLTPSPFGFCRQLTVKLPREWKPPAIVIGNFLACYYLSAGTPRFADSSRKALQPVTFYIREHVLLCLAPALFIAGAIAVFVSLVIIMATISGRIYGCIF